MACERPLERIVPRVYVVKDERVAVPVREYLAVVPGAVEPVIRAGCQNGCPVTVRHIFPVFIEKRAVGVSAPSDHDGIGIVIITPRACEKVPPPVSFIDIAAFKDGKTRAVPVDVLSSDVLVDGSLGQSQSVPGQFHLMYSSYTSEHQPGLAGFVIHKCERVDGVLYAGGPGVGNDILEFVRSRDRRGGQNRNS